MNNNTIYCGNNAQHPDLLNGTKILGTRYSCLQKGKNNGFNQPVDPNFLLPYEPIDTTRKYCGNKASLPASYDRFGGLYECYLSGVGVGKKLKARGIIETPSPVVSSLSSLSSLSYQDRPIISLDSENYSSRNSDEKYASDDSKESVKSYESLISGLKRTSSGSNLSNKKESEKTYINYIGVFIYLLGLASFFIGMYYGKPSIILYTDKENKDKIDWSKFIPYLVSFSVLYGVLLYFFIKYLFK